jgi:hypothetical protein
MFRIRTVPAQASIVIPRRHKLTSLTPLGHVSSTFLRTQFQQSRRAPRIHLVMASQTIDEEDLTAKSCVPIPYLLGPVDADELPYVNGAMNKVMPSMHPFQQRSLKTGFFFVGGGKYHMFSAKTQPTWYLEITDWLSGVDTAPHPPSWLRSLPSARSSWKTQAATHATTAPTREVCFILPPTISFNSRQRHALPQMRRC